MPSWLLALSREPGQAQVLTSDLGGRGTKETHHGVTELLLAPGAKLKGRKKEGGSALSKACPQAPDAFTLGWGVVVSQRDEGSAFVVFSSKTRVYVDELD